MKKFLCVLLTALLTLSFASGVFAADYWDEHMGTEGDPYVIDSNADLIALRDRVDTGIESADKYYKLTQNLTISSITGWIPIGTDSYPFKGHFDGNNLAIQINITSSSNWINSYGYYNHYRTGLFGTVSPTDGYAVKKLSVSGAVTKGYAGGIISKLDSGTVENCSFSGNIGDVSERRYSGGIVSYMTGGTVKNCSFSGSIKGESGSIGGIVGEMTGGSIESCTSNATIEETDTWSNSGCGGIVGYAQLATFSYIKDCTFSGSIKAVTRNADGYNDYVGGIAGYVSGGNLQNNTVTASTIECDYLAGGIAGRIGDNVTLEDCNVGSGTTVTAKYEAAGGIVGLINDNSTVKNNTSYAQILGDTTNKGGIIGKIVSATYTITGNKFANAEHGIGYDSTGVWSDEGCEKIGPNITITTTALSDANAGEAYSVTLKTDATEGTSVTWSMANSTTLPDGLNLNSSTGVISGTPTKAGTYKFTVQATAGSTPATKELTLKVNLVIKTAASLPAGTVDKSYSQTLEATGATSVTWALKTGSTLPSGLALSGSKISGTPKEAVTGKTFTIVATGNGMTAERAFSLTINASGSDSGGNSTDGTQNDSTGSTINEATQKKVAETLNVNINYINFITQNNILVVTTPSNAVKKATESEGFEITDNLTAINVTKAGQQALKVSLPSRVQGKNISDVKIYFVNKAVASLNSVNTATLPSGMTEGVLLDSNGNKITTTISSTSAIASANLESVGEYNVYLAQKKADSSSPSSDPEETNGTGGSGGGGCNAGFGIMTLAAVLAIFKKK